MNIFIKTIKYPFSIIIIFSIIISYGLYCLYNLPIDAFPDLTNNQVSIITDCEGMDPLEIEQLVTIPIENSMTGITNIDEVRSISKFGVSVVTVVFKDNVKTYFARQLVSEKLQSILSKIPQGIQPEIAPPTTAMGEIYQYVVEGKGYSAIELKNIHDWDIKYQLKKVPGISEVNTAGGFTKEYHIILDLKKIIKYNISLDEVILAIRENNKNFTVGIVENNSEQYIIRGIGKIKNIEDIENILVKKTDSFPILIKNIAKVEYSYPIRQGAVTKDGIGEVVTGMTMMQKGENSRRVIAKVKEEIKNIQKILPEGIKIVPFYDQTNLIEQTVKTVKTNLIEAGFLVIAVLLFMLGNIKAALIVSITIPISMMFSFIGMSWLGISANIMSLGAVDFGMIIDSSVVIVEDIIKKISHSDNYNSENIIINSIKEMSKPIIFGILIIVAVYIPILSLEGIEYRMFSPMVFTVSFALLGSLIISLTLVPVLIKFFIKEKVSERESFIIRIIKPSYNKVLNKAIENKFTTISIVFIIFCISILKLFSLGTEFVPKLDEGDILIEMVSLPSISLDSSVKKSLKVENILKKFPEVKTVVSKTGRPDFATDTMGTHQTDIFVILKDKKLWRKGVNKQILIEEMSKELNKKIIGTSFSFTQPIAMRLDEMISGVRADVAVKIFGDSAEELQKISEKIEKILLTVKGNADVKAEKLLGSMQLIVEPNREKMAFYHVNIEDISNILSTSVSGLKVSELVDGRKRFNIRIKFDLKKMDIEELKNIIIKTKSGNLIKLGQILDIQLKQDLDFINREFGQRRIVIQSNVRGRDIGSFVKEAQEKIDKQVKLPSGYYIDWGGQFENQERALKRLSIVLPISILVIFILLMSTFSSIKQSLIVMLNIPFALTGGIFALWLRDLYLSVPAIIGFIALFGVAVLNGIVLVSTINKKMNSFDNIKDIIVNSCNERLRPVLMTAMVAGFGFIPMALSNGSGAEVQRPLATVVIGGIISSTVLTLVVLPIIYYITFKKKMI